MGTPDRVLPFPTSMSLEKVIDFWTGELDRPGSPWSVQAREVLRRLEETPELRGARIEPAVARKHPELVRMLLSAHFPAPIEGVYGNAGEPFTFDVIYSTPGAERLGVLSEESLFTGTRFEPELMAQGSMMGAYEYVLRMLYGIDVDFDPPLVLTVPDPDTGLQRHFQLLWDPRFMTITEAEGTGRATPEELDALLAEPMDFERWFRILPPERFELGGLGITWAVEVTMPEANSLLKEALLREDALSSPARIDELQTHIRTLLGRGDIEIGLIALLREGGIEEIDRAVPLGRSLLLKDGSPPECPLRGESSYAQVLQTSERLVIRKLEGCSFETGFEQSLIQTGIRSLALLPLFVDGNRVGLLEVGSTTPGAMTLYRTMRLDAVTSAFATAMERNLAGREDRIRSVIKERYTAIHPAVEWRFRDAAAHILGIADHPDHADQEEIVFSDIYPLYGLTDIRGSSDARARAIQADLATQIEGARAVVEAAAQARSLPALGELGYRLGQLTARVDEGVISEDESQVLSFLAAEVEPLMDQLAGFGPEVAERVAAYRSSLDPELRIVYRERRDFEATVARFNEVVCSVIDGEQEIVQKVFPHLFERFKTDGVDYNAYVGESLAEKGGFSPLYLHNLRLWQLQLASRIQWALDRARPDFRTELRATHLILVQDHPLSIRFRVDEKRFDVDGAYNIRYELVKKRIDKARIRGSGERLTQPGTLAVVYGHRDEAAEYRRYLEFLIDTGFLEGAVEHHELEDMQGVVGLKAFRVVIPSAPPTGSGVDREAGVEDGREGAGRGPGRRPTLAEVEELGAGR